MTQRGRYERLRTLASGGMATVYLGRTQGVGGFERLVAVKEMHPHLAKDPQFVKMFLDEARIAASIRHPNVVSVLDVEAQGEDIRLVMEYVEGPSLYQLIKSLIEDKMRFPLDVAVRILIDTLSGLHAAHELEAPGGVPLNLVHRDVSPQNILIGIDGLARITDFGVVYGDSRLQQSYSGQVKGKIGYMAPQQLVGEPIDRRSDLYSVGVVFWELLTGRRLFVGDNDGSIALAAARGVQSRPREFDPNIPEALDAVCMRALQIEPSYRFSTAAEFSDALEEASFRSGIRPASNRIVAELVQRFEEERPTQLRPDAAKAWMEELGLIPSQALSAAAAPPAPSQPVAPAVPAPAPSASRPRSNIPAEHVPTQPIPMSEAPPPSSEGGGTAKMDWPEPVAGVVDLSDEDSQGEEAATVMKTMRMDSVAGPLPTKPAPEPPSVGRGELETVLLPIVPVVHHAQPVTSPNTSAGSLVISTDDDPVPPPPMDRRGSRIFFWLCVVATIGCVAWGVRTWLMRAKSPARATPSAADAPTDSDPTAAAPPPPSESEADLDSSPAASAEATPSASASVPEAPSASAPPPDALPPKGNAPPPSSPKPPPPFVKKPPPGDDTMIREVPF